MGLTCNQRGCEGCTDGVCTRSQFEECWTPVCDCWPNDFGGCPCRTLGCKQAAPAALDEVRDEPGAACKCFPANVTCPSNAMCGDRLLGALRAEAKVEDEPGAANLTVLTDAPDKTVQAKLAEHDEYAKAAVRYLIDWLRDEPEPLLAMARGRHAEGHYRYGDKLMFEFSQDELVAEAAQELADAVCYLSLLLRRSV